MPNSPKRRCIRSTSTTILDLNDHVLCKTFENLDDNELCTVADVFSTFRRNAQAVFSNRYRQKHLRISIWYTHQAATDLRRAYSILRNFGPLIKSLNLTLHGIDAHHSNSFFKMFDQLFAKTLNELVLYGITFTKDLILTMEPLLKPLLKMKVYNCRFDAECNPSEMFSLCAELHTVSLHNVQNTIFPIRINIPNLKSLTLRNIQSFCSPIDCDSFGTFLEVNSQLKEIEIDQPYRVSSENIQTIAKYVPQLRKLRITIEQKGYDWFKFARHLKQLRALEWLDVSCSKTSFSPVISELAAYHVPLKCLCLNEFYEETSLFDRISELRQLKTLVFGLHNKLKLSDIVEMVKCLSELSDLRFWSDNLAARHCLEIIQRAPKLQYLQIYQNLSYHFKVTLNIDLYMKILKVVAERKEPLNRMNMNLGPISLKVPQAILKANRQLLMIETRFECTPIRHAT